MDVRSILSHELLVGDYLGVIASMHRPEHFRRVEKLEYIDPDLGQALGEPLWPAETGAATWSEALAQRSALAWSTSISPALSARTEHWPSPPPAGASGPRDVV
jgi:hypothetical protein